MFDFSWSEIILIGVVGMILIGPKDLPKVIRWGTDILKKCRKMASEFQSQFDEVIKEADLKEAHEQFQQLRQLNLRSAVMNTLDRDGSLQKTFSKPPLYQDKNLSSENSPSAMIEDLPSHVVEERPQWGVATEQTQLDDVDLEALEKADPAPNIIPPSIAQKLQVRRAAPPAPAFIPPHIVSQKQHGGW